MKDLDIHIAIRECRYDELPEADQALIGQAKEATTHSYSPYSHFSVGAAVLLANGVTVRGSNQENAAYPSGLCAERTTLFYANSQYPDCPVMALAIAAQTGGKFIDSPISPCGACRQVMLETENRYNHPVRVLLYGEKKTYVVDSVKDLLPLSFDGSEMEQAPASRQTGHLVIPLPGHPGFRLEEALLEDALDIYEAIDKHRDYLKTWLPFAATLDEQGEETFIASVLEQPYEERNIVFLVKQVDTLCGIAGFVNTDNINHRTEIGYWLLPDFQGKGIMTECVRELIRFAIEERDMHRIQIRCATGNKASNAIPLRLGFGLEGTERDGEQMHDGSYTDINVYSLLNTEFH